MLDGEEQTSVQRQEQVEAPNPQSRSQSPQRPLPPLGPGFVDVARNSLVGTAALLGILAAWPRWRWTAVKHDRIFAACVCAVAVVAGSRAFSEAGVLQRPMFTQPEEAIVLATLAILVFTFTPFYRDPRKRRLAVAAYRLLVCRLVPPNGGQPAEQLGRQPAGVFADAAGILIGTRAEMLFILGLGLPLDLPAHLLVHGLCVALVLPRLPACCNFPLLAAPEQQQRIAAFMSAPGLLTSALSGALVPPDRLLDSARAQCTAALNFVVLTVGFLLPTYVVAWRSRVQAAAAAAEAPAGERPGQAAGGPPADSTGASAGSGSGSSPEGSVGQRHASAYGVGVQRGGSPAGRVYAGGSSPESFMGSGSPYSSPYGSPYSSPYGSPYSTPASVPSTPRSVQSSPAGSQAGSGSLAAVQALVSAGSALQWVALSCIAAWLAAAALALSSLAEG
ncbi:hypothetical protein ABPG75_010879 [Micractinium tetrahymenae]